MSMRKMSKINAHEVTFAVGPKKEKIHALAVALKMYSPTMEKLFKGPWARWDPSKRSATSSTGRFLQQYMSRPATHPIPLPDTDPTAFKIFLQLLLSPNWDGKTVKALRLDISTQLKLLALAETYEASEMIRKLAPLGKAIEDRIFRNFHEFAQTKDFLGMSSKELVFVFSNQKVRADPLGVFKSACSWASHQCFAQDLELNGRNQRKVLEEAFKQIPFSSMTSYQFAKYVCPTGILFESEQLDYLKSIAIRFEESRRNHEDERPYRSPSLSADSDFEPDPNFSRHTSDSTEDSSSSSSSDKEPETTKREELKIKNPEMAPTDKNEKAAENSIEINKFSRLVDKILTQKELQQGYIDEIREFHKKQKPFPQEQKVAKVAKETENGRKGVEQEDRDEFYCDEEVRKVTGEGTGVESLEANLLEHEYEYANDSWYVRVPKPQVRSRGKGVYVPEHEWSSMEKGLDEPLYEEGDEVKKKSKGIENDYSTNEEEYGPRMDESDSNLYAGSRSEFETRDYADSDSDSDSESDTDSDSEGESDSTEAGYVRRNNANSDTVSDSDD